MALDLIATGFLTLLLVVWLKEKILYVIFPWAFVQNFVLAWAYTSGWMGKDLCQALLISKEFLLLWLFLYLAPKLIQYGGGKWPAPLGILAAFTGWCVIRQAIAGFYEPGSVMWGLYRLRLMCYPLQILGVAVAVTWAKPEFASRFIRRMTYLLAGFALAGLLLYFLPGVSFWQERVNMADYSIDIKGFDEGQVAGELGLAGGIVGNGVAREVFTFISSFRAFGTVGDAVGFGHLMAFPVLLLAFWPGRNWKTQGMLALTAAALFLSFTRSAWIFVVVGGAYVLLRKERYRLVIGLTAVVVLTLALWAPLAEWYSEGLADLASGSSGDQHAEGMAWIYKEGLWKAESVLGAGVPSGLMESGYGNLLVMYGLPGLLLMVWFCIALYRVLRRSKARNMPLLLIAQAVPLVLLIDLNFSGYPFYFIPYLLTWFVVGACLATSSAMAPNSRSEENPLFPDLAKA